jgi:hypothetical protein
MLSDPRKNQPTGSENGIEKRLFLTGDDTELLRRTLSEIKTRAYERELVPFLTLYAVLGTFKLE